MIAARCVAAALCFVSTVLPVPSAHAQLRELLGLERGIDEPWTGDFDGMVERRRIRVLVVPSRTSYFVDKGRERGVTHDAGRAFEEDVNRKLGKRILKVEVVFVPVKRDDLLPALLRGRGDIAAAGLTITPERVASSRGRSARAARSSGRWSTTSSGATARVPSSATRSSANT